MNKIDKTSALIPLSIHALGVSYFRKYMIGANNFAVDIECGTSRQIVLTINFIILISIT